MKKSRFSDSQIIAVSKQAGGSTPVPELCRQHGSSAATFYKWRGKFGGMDASLMSQLRVFYRLHHAALGRDPELPTALWHPFLRAEVASIAEHTHFPAVQQGRYLGHIRHVCRRAHHGVH